MHKSQKLAITLILALGLGIGTLILNHSPQPAAPHEHNHGAEDEGEAHGNEAEHGHEETDGESHVHDEEEDVVHLSEAQIRAAAIVLAKAQPARLDVYQSYPGMIGFDEDHTAHVVPRASGVVEEVFVTLGQAVEKGQLLAVLASQPLSDLRSEAAAGQRRLELARATYAREERLWEEQISAEQDYQQARQGLQDAEIVLDNARQKLRALGGDASRGSGNRLELRAPFAGMIVAKHLVLGEVVNEATSAFTVADLSRVWANFSVAPRDLSLVHIGTSARVAAPDLDAEVAGTVTYIGNLIGEQTRTATARVTLDNPQGAWRPGLFVNVRVVSESREVPVSVPEEALQTFEERPTVFVRTAEGFVAQPVSLGERGNGYVEIVDGLTAGTEVAAAGSFVIKSELGKASASHSH